MPAPPEESEPATVSTGGSPCGCLVRQCGRNGIEEDAVGAAMPAAAYP